MLAPLGVPSYAQQESFSGSCPINHTTIRIEEHGVLRIENDYREYQIPLPTDIDRAWLSYRLGDDTAYLGNCSSAYYPYDDTFCEMITTRIGLIGWH